MDRYSAKKITKEKRQNQTCRVYEVKLDRSKLSQNDRKHIHRLFTEAKWFYNYCLSQNDVNNSDTTTKSVPVKVGEEFEDRAFSVLTAQMKQSIKTRLFNSMSSLKTLKQNGHKIGRLKFKSRLNSIPLKQLGKAGHSGTYYIDFDHSRIRIQGMKKWFRVVGLNQISKDVEIANATLVRKVEDFYLHITTFTHKEEEVVPEASVGIDFGCDTQLTFSNGIKTQFQVPASKRLRRLDRKIMKKNRPDSKNKQKDRIKRQKEYEKLTNKKKDIRQKIVSTITKNFKYVCFQDENIHAWKSGRHGKKVYNSGIGGIISDLKNESDTPLEVDRFFPSTQLCPSCGQKNKLSLSDRMYVCDCGFVRDRD
ncbi:MAG: transposase, partial [Candidatus Competibacteraceae bacterium]|nr:transposase [Candidatus Competibacteraceae bacterium]